MNQQPCRPFVDFCPVTEIVNQNRHNHVRMYELLAPLMQQSQNTAQIPFSSGLQMACLYGDLNLAKMLVSRGENIDQVCARVHMSVRFLCACRQSNGVRFA